eukprot:tig00000037_g10105.t1
MASFVVTCAASARPCSVSSGNFGGIGQRCQKRRAQLLPTITAKPRRVQFSVQAAAQSANGSVPAREPREPRIATVNRTTGETTVKVTLNIDGTGKCSSQTGIPFLDHMLHQISSHGLVDLDVWADGDLHIDDHHTNEDVGITLGLALAKALGDKTGVNRFGHFVAPLDEALVQVALDFSGRPHLEYGLQIPTEHIGKYDTQLVREFYVALASNAQMTLHIRQLAGINSHHIVEASFKAFARALRQAAELDPRRVGAIPSSKGVLGEFAVAQD